MSCRDYEHQIGDYVDGTLAPAARRAVEAHLAKCATCGALASDFASIRALAQTLECHAPPARIWQQVSSAAAAPRRSFMRLPAFAWQPIAAAAMIAVLTTSLWWLGTRLAGPVVPTAGDIVLADAVRAEAEDHYVTAIARLEQVTTAERDALDPETADVLQTGIAVIDDAIEESRAALDTDPDSELAQESLFDALRRKVALLQYMFALINEMRKGDEGGAARVLSELNP